VRVEFDKPALLEAVFEHYSLSYKGRRGKCLCPVHDESTPSAVFDLETGRWECFACTESGDGLAIIMSREKVSFPDAVGIAQRILDASSTDVRGGTGWKSSTGVSRSSRDKSASRKYVPSWVRGA
jgi:DNA primase